MRTLVISDLHVGSRTRVDVLRRREVREALVSALPGVDRLVLLGDTLELRHGPAREALEVAKDLFGDFGRALSHDAEVVLVPGNHDHGLISYWLERRGRDPEPAPLGLANDVDVPDGEALGRLAGWLRPARLRVSYPGVWLRDDVYAMHGHYLDRHLTVPTFERLAVGVMNRLAAAAPRSRETPERYEAALAPIYAWIGAMARTTPPARGAGPHTASSRIWKMLAGESSHRPLRSRALRAAFALTIATLNRAGLGPLRANVSGRELRSAGLRAMGAAVSALGVDAEHVVFGHTHRSGPWPRDDLGEWRTPSGAALINTGCWIYEQHFLTATPGESPYWPGAAVLVEDDGPPRLIRLLAGKGHRELSPRGATPARRPE